MVNNQFILKNIILNNSITKLIILLYFLCSSTFFISKALATIDPQNNVEINNINLELIKLLNNIKFMHAEFNQKIFNKYEELLQEQSGIIQLKKPNLLNWHVLKPDRLLIIIDGKHIWNYDIDLEQITVKKFTMNNPNYKIINLLLGNLITNLHDYKIILLKNCEAQRCFRLIHKKNSVDYNIQEKIHENFIYFDLGFNQEKLVLLKLYDQLSQQTVIRFYKFKSIPKQDVFKFIIPQNIDIIREVDE